MCGDRTVCEFQVNPRSVYATGTISCPALKLNARPTEFNPVVISRSGSREERQFSIISHDLGLYLDKGQKYGGTYISSIQCKGLPIRSWWKNNSIEFIAPVDYFKLNAIERERKKDAVLVVSGSMLLAIHPKKSLSSNDYYLQIDEYVEAELEIRYHIAQSDWIENLLSRLGHRKFYLLELDLTHCEINTALEYISSAESAISETRYVDAAIRCRDMMDYLEKDYLAFSEGDYRQEKWVRISSYFKHFTSLSGHQEEMKSKFGDFAFDRYDAELAVVLAKAIIRYAQQLSDE